MTQRIKTCRTSTEECTLSFIACVSCLASSVSCADCFNNLTVDPSSSDRLLLLLLFTRQSANLPNFEVNNWRFRSSADEAAAQKVSRDLVASERRSQRCATIILFAVASVLTRICISFSNAPMRLLKTCFSSCKCVSVCTFSCWVTANVSLTSSSSECLHCSSSESVLTTQVCSHSFLRFLRHCAAQVAKSSLQSNSPETNNQRCETIDSFAAELFSASATDNWSCLSLTRSFSSRKAAEDFRSSQRSAV
mmetsp:Transcript_64297/g.170308  ORF Transcript_64297/g.170308 Transcript_64297/m.170308 type:complete len:250 (-) Transcript_64297:250-999(-)